MDVRRESTMGQFHAQGFTQGYSRNPDPYPSLWGDPLQTRCSSPAAQHSPGMSCFSPSSHPGMWPGRGQAWSCFVGKLNSGQALTSETLLDSIPSLANET